jgi:hypothetical protein
VNNLLKENQNIVRISNWEASNLSPSLKWSKPRWWTPASLNRLA